jgi:hypothetical protein
MPLYRFEKVSIAEKPVATQSDKRKAKPPQATEILLKKRLAHGDTDHRAFAAQTGRNHQLASETFQRYDKERVGHLDCKHALMAMADLQIKLDEEEVKSIVAQYEEESENGSTGEEGRGSVHEEHKKGVISKDKVRLHLSLEHNFFDAVHLLWL